jgi:hypothetical protein
MMPDQLSSKWRKWWWVIAAVAIVTFAGLLWRPPHPAPETAFGCPEHEIQVPAYESVVDTIPIAPTTAAIPEFHDCQRFLIGGQFGPLVAIWAAESVAHYFPRLKPGEADQVAYAMAEILDLGNGPNDSSGLPEDYAPLGIARGFNCLYLWRSAAPDRFEARIVPQPKRADLKACAGTRPVDRGLAALPGLSVRATAFGPGDSLPPVARWDWDSYGGVQYISIWCGTAWCEIGPKGGFTPSRAIAMDPSLNSALDAGFENAPGFTAAPARWSALKTVKGWYDQQELEIWNDAAGHVVPSTVVGTIVPHPVLGAIGNPGLAGGVPNFDKHWMPAAYIYVPAPFEGKKLQLGAGLSQLYLCRGTGAECSGAEGVSTASGTLWYAKLISPGHATRVREVTFDDHGGMTIPAAAARWRWLESDGTTWVRCGTGCCTDN